MSNSSLNQTQSSEAETLSGNKRKRKDNHVTKACDECRTRKSRCDGRSPVCGACEQKQTKCTFDQIDRRKNRRDQGDLIQDLFRLLRPAITPTDASSRLHTADPSLFPEQSVIATPDLSAFFELDDQPVFDGGDQIDLDRPLDVPACSLSGVTHPGGIISSSAETSRTSSQPPWSPSDRLKLARTGAHMQYGSTSLWSYASETPQPPTNRLDSIDLGPGDWVDWARNLPTGLKITKKIHDSAIDHFAAYYAPWCLAVDMPTFSRDIEVCNLVTRDKSSPSPPTRTSAYSPLLHNCILLLGLHLNRDRSPELAAAMGRLIAPHCADMLIEETDDPNLSTPRALALFAACMNLRKDSSAHNTGYIHFGMAYACVQALGVNVKCDHLVGSGQMSSQDRDLRNAMYWTLFQQDLLRAICAGRPCMLNNNRVISLPAINPLVDNELWLSTVPGNAAHGMKCVRSTTFHWSSKLAGILRQVVEIALSTEQDNTDRDTRVKHLLIRLDTWCTEQPFQPPQSYPLPHVLILHMLYHLTTIYLLRPYFRAASNIVPSPAIRCEEAAEKISELLRIFDRTHGLRNGVATIIPVIFASSTIRLLTLVSCSAETEEYRNHTLRLDESIAFMDTISSTWVEARRGIEIIRYLRAEWLPGVQTDPTLSSDCIAELWKSDEISAMLKEWSEKTGFYDVSSSGF